MVIKTLEELASWTDYRKQTSECLKGLKEDGSIHISVADFDFEVGGNPWPGRVVLCGAKGSTTMAALKKAGVQFRSGTASLAEDGVTVQVQGLSSGLLKAANKTLSKLSLSHVLEVAEADRAEDRRADADRTRSGRADAERDHGAEASEVAAEARNAAKERRQLVDRLRTKKLALRDRIQQAMAGDSPDKTAVARLVKAAAEREKQGDLAAALAALEELEGVIAARGRGQPDAGETPEDVEVEADEGDETEAAEAGADARAEADRRKAPLYQRIREAIAQSPELRDRVAALVRQADAQEKAADHDARLATYEQLEDAVAVDAGDDDDEAAADKLDIRQWQQYRSFLRPRLRKVSRTADALDPLFVSKKKFEFDIDGKVWRGQVVLAGNKSRPLVQRLKREGLPFLEGQCHVAEDRTILAVGMSGGARKAAARTLKLLMLGYKIDLPEDDAGTAETPSGNAGLAAEYAKRRAALDPALRNALARRLGDTGGLRAADAMAVERAERGDWQAALAALGRIERLLAQPGANTADTGGIEPGLVNYRQSLLQFAQTKTAVRTSLTALHRQIAALDGEADLAEALSQRLEAMFEGLSRVVDAAMGAVSNEREPVTATVRSEVEAALHTVESDPLLAHVEANRWNVSIRGPLLQSLQAIQRAMPRGARPRAG